MAFLMKKVYSVEEEGGVIREIEEQFGLDAVLQR
jgi:hypothetical protein